MMAYSVTVRFDVTKEFISYHVNTDDTVKAIVQVQRYLKLKGFTKSTITAYHKVSHHQNFDVCI